MEHQEELSQYLTLLPALLPPLTWFLAVATPLCHAGRGLLKKGRWADDIGDPSGYLAVANSRSFVPGSSKASKSAVTPEAAETGANPSFNGGRST